MRNNNLSATGTSITENNQWGTPQFIEALDTGNSIEFIYKQYSTIHNLYNIGYMPNQNQCRVFKIVYSCIEGKWHKSEPIYGTVIPASEEYYEFED